MSKKQSSIQKESDKLSMKQKLYFAFSAKVNQLAALILLIPGLPIMLFLIILVHITSPGPAIYKQRRVGKDGKVFNLMKIRTMLKDAEAKTGPVWTAKNDPRITRLGRILRPLHLDELPQLVNTLMGNMSLVGPRPLVKGELEAHNGLKLYERVKPAITGRWGCNRRSNIDYRERLELEYY